MRLVIIHWLTKIINRSVKLLNLDFFSKLKNITKDKDESQKLIENLEDFLKNELNDNNSTSLIRKEISLIQSYEKDGKLTTPYRDKMLIERSNFLEKYANENLGKGDMYYIYSKSSKGDKYNLCLCGKNSLQKVITLDENQLPSGAGVDSILRFDLGKYVLDNQATEYFLNEMDKMIKNLIETQNIELSNKRIEKNKYEIVEIYDKSASITNVTQNNGECFEEIIIAKEILKNANPGDLLEFVNGEYKVCKK